MKRSKSKKTRNVFIFIIFIAAILSSIYFFKNSIYVENNKVKTTIPNKYIKKIVEKLSLKRVEIENIVIEVDKDNDGIYDLDDIVEGARVDAKNKPRYKSAYYDGGYPPESEGVCTDVIWRALKYAGYNLKDMIDKDIKEHTEEYTRVEGKPDPNIDFRRVQNLYVFFEKYAEKLTTELKPYEAENLKEWQGGDIIIFKHPQEHVVIVSSKRRRDGVPYIIHNCGPYTKEQNDIEDWMDNIIGHYRFPKSE